MTFVFLLKHLNITIEAKEGSVSLEYFYTEHVKVIVIIDLQRPPF